MNFYNNKEKKDSKKPVRYIEKMITNFWDALSPEVRRQGINIGKNNPPKPDGDILEIPYVGSIIAKITGFFNDISGSLENTIQEYKTKFEQACRQLKDNNTIATLTSILKGLETQKESDLKNIDEAIQLENNENKATQEKIEKQIRQNKIAIGEHPFKNVFWPILFAVFVSLGILSSEIFVNQKAFLFQAGENFFTSLVIAIGISFFTFSMGLATAKILQNSKIATKNKFIYITFISLIVIGVALGIAEMRTTMMEIMSAGQTGRSSFVVSKFTLVLINIGFYVSLVIVKLFFIPSPKVFESNRKHLEIKSDTNSKEKILKQLKTEAKNFPKKATSLKKEVINKYNTDKEEIEEKLKDNYKQIRSYQVAYNKNLSIANNVHKQLTNVAKQAIGIFIQQVNLFSSDDSQIQIPTDAIPELENPFKNYQYIDANTIDLLFATETFKASDYEKN